MNAVLEQTLRLACLIRDTPEAAQWRDAWHTLDDFETVGTPSSTMSLDQRLCAVRSTMYAAECRPFFFPLLISKMFSIKRADFDTLKKSCPSIWAAHEQLITAMAVADRIFSFLRRTAPGHPHEKLVYTLPYTPWVYLSGYCEVPVGIQTQAIRSTSSVSILGLQKIMPTRYVEIEAQLARLFVAVKSSAEWKRLEKTHMEVIRNGVLSRELTECRAQFDREYHNLAGKKLPGPTLELWLGQEAEKMSGGLRPRNQAYIESYLEYERLLERIYWLVSQVVFYNIISCITTAKQRQIQQVTFSQNKATYLTALALTDARTLQVGQLVHISMPEADNIPDGIYQIERWWLKYSAATSARIFFTACSVWPCTLPEARDVTSEFTDEVFKDSEERDKLSNLMIAFGKRNEQTEYRVRDLVTNMNMEKAFYLPWYQ